MGGTMCKIRGQGREDFEGEGAKIGTLHRASTGRCRGRDSRARRCTAEPNRAALKRKQSPELSLRGPNGAVAISGRQLRFRRYLPHYPTGYCKIATGAKRPRNDKLGSLTHSPEIPPDLQLPKAVTTRKGYAASVRQQSRQRLRSDRRYRRNWCIPFYRRPVRVGSASPRLPRRPLASSQ